ncbi:MAG: hypothetical protein SNF33_06820 [Candidatus Algichlamydia australiensis]|nr:hypothetical protein [Chlamydiales bacterium]
MKLKTYLKKDLHLITQIFRDHMVILLLILLSYIATYALNLYLANLLKPELYGNISIVFQLLLFTMPFALLGTELSMMHFLPKYFHDHEYPLASGFIRWNFRLFGWISLVVLALGGMCLSIALILEGIGVTKLTEYNVILYSFWLIPLFALIVLLATLLQTMGKFYLATSFRGFALSFMILLVVFLFLHVFETSWVGGYRKTVSLIICLAIAYLSIIGLEIYFLRKTLPKKIYKVKPHYQKSHWVRYSIEMLGSFLGYTALAALEILLLQFFGANQEDVGHFASILVISSSMMVLALAVDMFVNPLISSLVHKNRLHLQSVLDIVNLFKLVPATLLLLVMIFFGESLLSHFGKSFEGAYPALLVLAAGYFYGLTLNSAVPLLLYSGHHRLNFKLSLVQFAFIVIASGILIPMYALEGAAIALSATIVFASTMRLFFIRKYLDIKLLFIV